MEVNFSDYINDTVRILILLNSVKDIKSLEMTDYKIKLYDYFLKFPYTMLGEEVDSIISRKNFDEYYAFFHWQPDLIRYRKSLNYLIAKGFIDKRFEDNSIIYLINDLGAAALSQISNSYKNDLMDLTKQIIPRIAKLTDSKIEQLIRDKSKSLMKTGEIKS